MRILHLGKYYHPHRGGMETVLREQAEGMAARGCEVTVLVAGARADSTRLVGGVRVVRAQTLGSVRSQPLTPTLPGLLRRELGRGRPDAVILHLPNPLAAAAWQLATLLAGRRRPLLALWHHADITRQKFDAGPARALQARCLARAAVVWTSSAALAAGSRELRDHRDKVSVVPFGIDTAPWCGLEPQRDGPFLFVGRLVAYKGLEVLLDAVVASASVRLDVVGDGPLLGGLKTAVAVRGLEGRVRITGALDDGDLLSLMGRARGLVLPSLDTSETFGLVQLEAMAAGLPVVASDLPTGVREVGVQGRTHFFVPPGDTAALARALEELAEDDALAARMGVAARERSAEFSRERMIDRMLADMKAALEA